MSGTSFDLSVMTEGEAQILLGDALLLLTRATYAALCFINITRYRRLLEDKYSNTDKVDLSWLKVLISGYLIARIGWSLTPVWLVFLYYSGHQMSALGLIIPYYTFSMQSD